MGAPASTAPPAEKTFTAESALTAFRFCKLGAVANGVTAVTGVTDLAMGVVSESVDGTGQTAVSVYLSNEGGIVPIEAAAAIALGARIAPSANGRGQTAVATQFSRGIALEAASGAGHVIPMLVDLRETAVV